MDLIGNKNDKNDLRKPDILKAELVKGFEWSQKHVTLLAGVVGSLLVVGLGYAGYQTYTTNKEKNFQGDLFRIESQIQKKQEAFDRFEMQSKKKLDPKDAKSETPEIPVGEKASGDLQKDFGSLPEELKAFVEKHAKSVAGARGALLYASLMTQYEKNEPALLLLNQVQPPAGLLATLVAVQKATLLANSGKCAEARPVFIKMAADPKMSFMKSEMLLKSGLCAETLGDRAGAEQDYQKSSQTDPESSSAKKAQKYLRLLSLTPAGKS
jgi:predicted negative regulator of RcsB-dependent stress response